MAVKHEPRLRFAQAPGRIRSSAIRDLLAVTEQPGVLSLAGGLPSPDAFPVDAIAAVTAEVLATDPGAALQYAATAGLAPLRAWIGADNDVSPDDVVVTHGAQQALELVVRLLVDPTDMVALADPAYVGAIQALCLAGADLLAIPSDGDGLRTDVLAERLAAGARPVLVYVVSQLDNPTGATLSAERRVELAHLADRYGFVIVDDDPYGALRWSGAEPTPLRSLSDRVVTLGTTSKVLCPGLRVGWAIAPPELARHLVIVKQAVDLQTTTLTQRIAHGVLARPGFLAPHLARLRSCYEARATALADALDQQLDGRLAFERPPGGMFLWARVPGVDTERLLQRAIAEGMAFVPGTAFAVDGRPSDWMRLSFATQSEPELAEAVTSLRRALD